jgi:hypothetical protein
VKNLGEFKTAQRVLLEGNIFENNWGQQSDQNGTAVIIRHILQRHGQRPPDTSARDR